MRRIALLFLSFSGTLAAQAFTRYVNLSGTCSKLPCYSSIQSAVNAASAGDTVFVEAGNYQENIIITKPLALIGAGQNLTTIRPAVSNVGSLTAGGTQVSSSSTVILIRAVSVTVSDLTVDGSNPNIANVEAVVNGVTIDARNGVITDASFFPSLVPYTNMDYHNLTVRNVFMRALQVASNFGNDNTATIHDCTVSNAAGNYSSIGIAYFYGSGSIYNNTLSQANINLNWTHDVSVQNNTITNVKEALHSDNSMYTTITNNTIDSRMKNSLGLFIYIPYGKMAIRNNQIRNTTVGLSVYASNTDEQLTFKDNTVDGSYGGYTSTENTIGLLATNDIGDYPPLKKMTINADTGNVISNVSTGVFTELTNVITDINGNVVATFPGDYYNETYIRNLQLKNISQYFIKLNKYGGNTHISNIDARNVVFDNYKNNLADGLAIEDRVFHKLDDPAMGNGNVTSEGLITFHDNKAYISNKDGNFSINRALAAYNKNGLYIGIRDKTSVLEDVIVNYDFSVYSDGSFSTRSFNFLSGNTIQLFAPALTNKLVLTKGYLANGNNTVSLPTDAVIVGGSAASHVTGRVSKTDPNNFSFPIGDGKNYKPLTINSTVSPGSVFEAQYFPEDPNQKVLPKNIIQSIHPFLSQIGSNEYWRLVQTKGSDKPLVSFSSTIPQTNLSDNYLAMAGNPGSGWSSIDENSTVTRSGNTVTFSASVNNPLGYITWGTKSTALKDVGVYPNPASKTITIVHLLSNITVRVIDAAGRTVGESPNSNIKTTLNIASLTNGNYFLALFDSNNNFLIAKKFLKIN